MLAEQRARAILQQISQRKTVSVTDLCQTTGASEATIRRDLNALARQGRLVKIHGGATSLEEEEFLAREPDLDVKQRYAREKERIARYAASLIGDDDVVYLDTGTTTLHMASHLKDSGALFVTSSIDLAGMLSAHERQVGLPGAGRLYAGRLQQIRAGDRRLHPAPVRRPDHHRPDAGAEISGQHRGYGGLTCSLNTA